MRPEECLLPATGGGLMLAVVATVLILAGSVAVVWSRRGRWLLVIALVAAGGLIGTERAQAAPAPCPPPPTVASPSTAAPTTTTASSTTVPAAATVSVSDSSPAAGDSIVVSGSGFPSAGTLSIELFSDPVGLGTATTDGTGSFTATVTIPADTPAGRHTLTVTGGNTSASTPITVTTPGLETTTTGASTTTTSPEPAPGAPNATDKTVGLIETEEITGSLLDGDDLGPGAAATIAAVWDAANDEPLAFGDRRALGAVNSGGTAAPCGAITVAPDGSYTFIADSDVAIETTCAVRYRLEHPAGGSDTATVTFTVSPGREPRVLNRFVTVERGEVLTGNLLDGADLGAPTGTLVSVANISAPKEYEFGVPDALTGLWLDETFDDCGELTIESDGSYRFAASATIGPWKCDFQYVVANPLGDDVGEVFITFEVEPPNAIDKTIFVVGAQTVTGSLLDDDDFGDVGAVTLFDVWDTATDASLQPDTPADLAGTDTNGDPADCGTISVDLDGNYTFTAPPVATEVTCAVAYIIEQDVTGQWDSATVAFTITPGSAPTATTKWLRVERGGEYTGNLLDGDDLGTPAAELVAVSSAGVVNVPFGQTVTLVEKVPPVGSVAPCGQVTVEANGDYRLQMVNVDPRTHTCPVQYRIENGYGSAEGRLTFTIGFDNPNATDKTITVAATQQVSGSLLAGDDLGNPQARFTREISELDGDGQLVGGFGTGSAHGLNGVDGGGSVVPCGTITVDNDGGYVFTAADVASEVTCSILYGLHVDGGGSDSAVVTFVVSPRPVEPAAGPTSTTSTTSSTSATSTTAPAPTTTTTPTPAPSTTTATTTTAAAPSSTSTTSTIAPEPSTTSTTLAAPTTSTTSTTTTSTPTTTTTTASSFM